MANELVVSFLRGPKANLANKEKSPGQVLFVLNNDNTGSIYYDENASTRYRMSYDLKDTTNKFTISAAAVSTTANRVYPVALDKDGYLAVCVPWSNTTYSAGTGLSLTGTQFKNTGVISVATGSTNGSISVKTGDANAVDVSVKGLQDLAYIAKDGASSTKFLKGDGTWAVPTDHTYNAGIGLTLSGSTFKAKLKSETAATNNSVTPGNTSGRQYAVVADKSGYLSVNVPWANDNTTYSASNKGITLASGNVFTLSLVSDTAASEAATTAGTASSKYYPVGLDKNSKLVVNVPWSNTTYTASSPITLTGTQFTINDGAITNAKLANHKITIAEKEIQLGGEASSNEIGSSPFVIGTQTAATGTWKGNVEFTSLVDGQQITYWLPFAGSGNATLTLTYPDGSTTAALPCYYGGTTRLTTHYAAGSIIRFIYRENVTIGTTTIAAGWWADANYDSGNTNDAAGYLRYFQNAAYVKPTTALYRYLILFSKGDGEHVIPANTTSNSTANTKTTITTEAFNIFEPIYYYSTTGTVNANANIDGRYFWFMRSDINLNYSFNIGSTLTAYKDVYVVATLETPVTAKLRNPGLTGTNAAVGGDGPIAQTLPTTEDGYIYIKLGHAYSTSNIILTPDHPIYEFKNGHLRRYEYDEYTASNKGIILDDYTFKLKLQSETALTGAAGTATNTANKYYPVALDSNGNLAVNIPWSNTTYSVGTGLSLTGTTFANTGIITLAAGTNNGQTKVNGTDTTIVKGLADLAYIAKDGASSTKFLKGDGTWATPTDHTYNAGIGLTLSGSTFKAKLKSETAATNDSATPGNTANRQYAVVADKSGYLSVNVPWANDNTTYSASNNGITLASGNVFTLSLVSNTAASESATTAGTTSGKYYPVGLDKNKKLVVNVPWSNTTYTAGTGLSLTGTQFANTGIVTLAVGTNNGQTKVNGTDTTIVKGLSDLAYIAKDGASSTKFLKGDGTWAVPTDHTYNAGIGLTLSGSTFKAKLKSETAATNDSATPGNTANRQYAVVADKSGYLSVNVPWANDNTTYSASNKGITLASGNVFTLSLVSDTAASEGATTAGTATGKYYPIGLDKNSKLVVNVPWSNTTYTATAPITLTGTSFGINDGAIANVKLTNHKITVAENEIELGGEASSNEIGSSPFVIGTQTAATGTWTGRVNFQPIADGQQITYWLPFAGSGNATLTLTYPDGSTTAAIPCYYSGTTRLTTHYAAGNIIHLTYRENVTIGTTTIAAGFWADANYDTNSNDAAGYIRYWNAGYMKPTTALYRYLILFSKGDGEHLIPANTTSNTTANTKATITTESFAIFEPIYYHSNTSTVNANANISNSYFWQMRSDVNLNYSFNIGSTLTAYKDVYLVAILDSPTTAHLRNPGLTGTNAAVGGNGPITQTLPTTNDGYIYIKLGHAYSTSNIILTLEHPIYFHDGTNLNCYSTGRGVKEITRSGTTFTATRDDGTTFTFTQQDNDHIYNAGVGLTLSGSTFKAKLKSETAATNDSATPGNTANRQYAVVPDKSGYLSVNVPWANDNTTYSASNKGITLASGNVFTLSLVSDTTASEGATTAGTTSGKYYPVGLDKNSKLVVNVPWSNTTYTAGTGLSLTGTQFANTGIVTLAVGTSNGQTKVNGTDTTIVKGLADLAYIAKDGASSTKFLKGDGTWAVPTDHTYNAGIGLTLSGSTFKAKLKSETAATNDSATPGNTANRQYAVVADKSGYLSVNVPWVNDNTTYSASNKGITLASGNVFTLSLVSDTAASEGATTAGTTTGKYYPVGLDKNSKLVVNVPWSNTTYTAGVGLTLSGTQFKAKLKTETAFTADSAAQTNTANRQYMVGVDKSGYLSVNVPWTDTDTNTDTKVTQSGVADNSELPIILKYTANTTSETTTVKYNSNSTAAKQTTVNPSTGTVSANIFRVATKVKLEYDATTESLNFVFI